jgi:hypothetical protein
MPEPDTHVRRTIRMAACTATQQLGDKHHYASLSTTKTGLVYGTCTFSKSRRATWLLAYWHEQRMWSSRCARAGWLTVSPGTPVR